MASDSSSAASELIKITGVNKDRTTMIQHNDNIYRVPFILNKSPPRKWLYIFNRNTSIFGPSTLREAIIEGENIIVNCKLKEIKEFILDELKKKVSETNTKYHESIQQQMAEILKQDSQEEKTEEDFMDIDDALDGVEF